MMDAYLLQQKLFDAWKELSPSSTAGDLKKRYNDVPVYVTVNNELVEIKDIVIIDGKVILKC